MHQSSAPTREYGAPALPITSAPSRRGRCAYCLAPIRDDQDAQHVTPPRHGTQYPYPNAPIPYHHTTCEERP